MRTRLRVLAAAIGAILVIAGRLPLYADAPTVNPSDAFFDNTVLHRVDLLINSRDWQSLIDNYLDNTYYPCDFKWNNQTVRNVGIRSRGNGSRSGVKPGLRVDINRYSTGQTFLGLKSFVLRNQTQDASNMHEFFSMLLYRRLGVAASREAFTQLYINNNYAGVYTIVESVDNTFLQNSFGENGGNLYSYDYGPDDPPWYFGYKGDDPGLYVPKPFKPETNTDDPRPESLRDWVRTVNNDSDAAFPINILRYMDWNNFTKHIAVENFVSDLDGFNGDYGINNFYLYRRLDNGQLLFIPWDKSEAFKSSPNGSISSGDPTLGIFHNFLDGDPAKRNRLTGRAMTQDLTRNLYLDTLLALANIAKELDSKNPDDKRGWMEREIEREYGLIKDAVYSDTKKPFTNDQFEQDVENVRNFARMRPDSVMTQVTNFRNGR
jgi:spore coat protein CotH